MQNILEVIDLKKSFNGKIVVDNISFSVEKQSLFAFLGQNGAGKTTTINMVIGLLKRDGGNVLYDGLSDFTAFKDRIGVVFQNNILDDLLTVKENLFTYGSLYIKSKEEVNSRLADVLSLLSLTEVANQRVNTLSGGQKRKAEIARALFMSPDILFLDEPTTGLDPKTRAEVWKIVHDLKTSKGMTIFLTTHYMEETSSADQVAIIDHGKIVASGSPVELKSKYAFDKIFITPKNDGTFKAQLQELNIESKKTSDTYMIALNDAQDSISLLHKLKDNILSYEVIKGSMDDVFLNIVGDNFVEYEVNEK